jgi:peptide/nickel transport system substrate-binding protein
MLVSLMPASPAQAQEIPYGGTLILGTVETIDTLNPYTTIIDTALSVDRNIYDTLVTYDTRTLGYLPWLAQSWDISPDGLTWTLHLVKNATWHDGTSFTSADVKSTFDLVLGQQVPIPFGIVGFVESVEAPDDYTVVLHTAEPSATMLYGLAELFIVPKHIWGNMTKDQVLKYDNPQPIGTGPFKFVEYKKSDHVTLKANENYWKGRPYVDELIYTSIPDEEAELSALRTGGIDYMYEVNPKEASIVESDPNLKMAVALPMLHRDIYMSVWENTTSVPPNPALKDVRVRQAFHRSIDKEALNNLLHLGMFTPAAGCVTPMAPYWYDANLTSEVDMSFNLTEAARMLDDAGYKDVDGSGIRQATRDISLVLPSGKTFTVPKGTKLDFSLIVDDSYSDEVRGAEMLNGWLHTVGMNIRISTASDAVLGADLTPPYPYDMMLWAWTTTPDPDYILSVYTTQQIGGWSTGGYSNPKYDQLYQRQRVTADNEKRREMVYEMQKIIYTDSPEIMLYYINGLSAYRLDKFSGWITIPPGGIDGRLNGYPRNTMSVHLIAAPAAPAAATEQPSVLPWAAMAVSVVVIIGLLGYITLLRRRKV